MIHSKTPPVSKEMNNISQRVTTFVIAAYPFANDNDLAHFLKTLHDNWESHFELNEILFAARFYFDSLTRQKFSKKQDLNIIIHLN